MPISHKLKTIFIHIPKNAGESIENALGIYGMDENDPTKRFWGVINNSIVLQHLPANDLKNNLSDDIWKNYFKFDVVRNPWSKAVSEYNWYLRYGPKISFINWSKSLFYRLKINSMIHILETGHNLEQYKFIFDNNGKKLIDEIIYFENLSKNFDEISLKNAWNIKLPHLESTKSKDKRDWRSFYCENSLDIICEIYKKDIELFGYSREKTFENIKIPKDPVMN